LFNNEKERRLVFFVLIFKKNFAVSHVPERKEKDCLNCGATVFGKYCHICGQENVVPKETFWSMLIHFFYDITHFDSKFFESVKVLVFRPGFLSKEFIKGRRTSYLHPVRMYVFTSAIFFLLFFSFFKPKEGFISNNSQLLTAGQRTGYINKIQNRLKKDPDNKDLNTNLSLLKDTSVQLTLKDVIQMDSGENRISISGSGYKSIREYDSSQNTLPPEKKDNWFMRRLVKKEMEINEKYHGNSEEFITRLGETVLHNLPYLLFVSLPLFALILKLVYIRRKQFYFADHGIFTIHLYIFSFLLLTVIFALDALRKATYWGIINFLIFLLSLGLFFYLYKAMRNFYQQRRAKTFIKFLFVAFGSFIMMILLFVFSLFFSAVTL
jgi:hypothetical protein